MLDDKKRLTKTDMRTQEEIDAQNEKFRTFFSTSVAQVPEEMNRRDGEQPASRSLWDRLFGRGKAAEPQPEPEEKPQTGEIVLGKDAPEEEDAGLELALTPEAVELELPPAPEPAIPPVKTDLAELARVLGAARPTGPDAAGLEPEPDLELPLTLQEESELPLTSTPKPEQRSAPTAPKEPSRSTPAAPPVGPRRAAPQEDIGLQELRDMLDQARGLRPARPEPQPEPHPELEPVPQPQPGPPAPVVPERTEPAPKPGPTQAPAPISAPPLDIPLVFAEERGLEALNNPQPSAAAVHEAPPAFRMFGAAEDEAETPSQKFDSMSLPLLPLDEEAAEKPEALPLAEEPAAPPPEAPAPAPEAPAAPPAAEAETRPEEMPDPGDPEQIAQRLRRMSASLTLRCVLSGILALVLLHLGLAGEGLLPPLAALDPDAAPAAFYGANFLLLAAACGTAYSVLRDGLAGLRGRPSADTMPALAAVGALLQAAVALLFADAYRTSGLTILSGIAAMGLFLALLGSRVMLAAVQGGVELAASGVGHQGAYLVRDKDLLHTLTGVLQQKDPWVLVSRPMEWDERFVERCFGERASERRARKAALILLGVAVFSGLVFLINGKIAFRAVAAMAAMLCLGAPFSSTLVAGLASLRLQRSAGAVGAVVPGWAAIEELGGVDTIQVDAADLFPPDSATLEDIRIFKGGRIDRAILYAASVLSRGSSTLQRLFRQITEDRTEILFPVKDLETSRGLGFSAWCDNQHILIGTRAYLQQQEVPLPEQEYEDLHSHNGERQVLYLAVSGNLYAMFVLRYVGGRNAARGLAVLQRESIRLLVTCQDPSLTARHITEAYHLPEGMITLVEDDTCAALAAAAQGSGDAPCCMVHLKGFVSLTGGLHAAEQAQTAETSALTVQMASVGFSIAIGLLLTYANSLGSLSVAAALMYQAAWGALSIAVCALKQHQ